jgi:hypothetical protein
MSREYVERRLEQIRHEGEPKQVLWSLTEGCWMLCDLARGTCEHLHEVPASPDPTTTAQSGDDQG